MNLNDRLALIIGRAVIRAESLEAAHEELIARITALEEKVAEHKPAIPEPDPSE